MGYFFLFHYYYGIHTLRVHVLVLMNYSYVENQRGHVPVSARHVRSAEALQTLHFLGLRLRFFVAVSQEMTSPSESVQISRVFVTRTTTNDPKQRNNDRAVAAGRKRGRMRIRRYRATIKRNKMHKQKALLPTGMSHKVSTFPTDSIICYHQM